MTRDQKIVATGAVSGIVGMALLVWALSKAIVPPALDDTAADRIGYALPWAVVAILPYFAMVAAVGNARFLSEAIDPTLGKEDQKTLINGRVADNTLQQFVLFLVGMLGLAVTLPIDRMGIVAAVAITFVVFRIVFWVGYRIQPLYRAPGFSSIAYMNLGMLLTTLWLWLRG
ncbi:MAG TPA: MAPEG family protein [Sphingomicrobium sp.]|nr:MAPEG family protein [Sphingomicrobium sp.]